MLPMCDEPGSSAFVSYAVTSHIPAYSIIGFEFCDSAAGIRIRLMRKADFLVVASTLLLLRSPLAAPSRLPSVIRTFQTRR